MLTDTRSCLHAATVAATVRQQAEEIFDVLAGYPQLGGEVMAEVIDKLGEVSVRLGEVMERLEAEGPVGV